MRLPALSRTITFARCDALGPYPAIGTLALAQYTTALGLAPPQPQGAPVR